MNGSDREISNIEKALTVFGQIIVDDRKEIKKDITLINKSLNELLISGAETRKERKFESDRNERIEGNQREQGQEVRHNSDTILKHSGKIEVLEKKQDRQDALKATILAGVIIIALAAYFGLR